MKKEDWVAVIDAKLCGKTASVWQDILAKTGSYQEAKDGLLKACGYTPKSAAEKIFGFRVDQSRGLTADQLYHRGQQLLRRVVAPEKMGEDMEFAILRGWLGGVIPKRAKAALDARAAENSVGLVNALRDFLELEGDKSDGQNATFKRSSGEFGRDKGFIVTCYKCGKQGHKAADCWKGGTGSSRAGSVSSGGVAPRVITCFTCQEEGHKSPQCPKNARNEKAGSKDVKPKSIKRVWRSQPKCVTLDGVVNGHRTSVLLDSGAAISIIPESMIKEGQLTGGSVAVKPFGASKSMLLPLASLPFSIGDLEWEEVVAVAPLQEGVEEEVLYSLDLLSDRGLQLVMMANSVGPAEVLRVTTRAQAKTESEEEENDLSMEAEDRATAWPFLEDGSVWKEVEEGGVLGRQEEDVVNVLGIEKDPYADGDEEVFELRQEVGGAPDLEVPNVRAGPGSRTALVSESGSDPTLLQWRALAEKKEQGFLWENSLLYKSITNHVTEVVRLLVLPKSFRERVMDLAHEKLGHMGSRRVLSLLRQKFVWPGMGQEVIKHCRSCPTCQKCAKPRARQVPMVERKILSEPFESMAFDLVGPIPKGKGGHRYLLTCVCMASKWPEAIPIRCMTANAVAQGMLEIFSRVGVPLRLLSDQGSQFVGKVVSRLCENLNIEAIQSTPYHPEGNG